MISNPLFSLLFTMVLTMILVVFGSMQLFLHKFEQSKVLQKTHDLTTLFLCFMNVSIYRNVCMSLLVKFHKLLSLVIVAINVFLWQFTRFSRKILDCTILFAQFNCLICHFCSKMEKGGGSGACANLSQLCYFLFFFTLFLKGFSFFCATFVIFE